TALYAACNGTNSGGSSKNIALTLNASGGTTNFDISGDSWNVNNVGVGTFASLVSTTTLTLGVPLTVPNGGTGYAVSPARTSAGMVTALNPTGYTSSVPQPTAMAGLGATGATITPSTSGTVLFMISGTVANGTGNDGTILQIKYGTGGAPTNGWNPFGIGTFAGCIAEQKVMTSGVGGVTSISFMPFTCIAYVTGLAVGVAVLYDIDIQPQGTGSMSTISGVSVVATEF